MRIIRRDPNKGYLDTLLWVPKDKVHLEGTKAALTFSITTERQARFLTLYQETDHHLLLPREFWDIWSLGWDFDVIDVRPTGYTQTGVRSRIQLDFQSGFRDKTQRSAVEAMREARGGILQLACGKGKTICALELIAQEGVPAIIIVDNTQLMEQWKTQIEEWLDIPGGVGLIKGDVFDWKKAVVLTTYHTLSNRALEFPEEARRWFGLIIWDEAHHMAAPTWAKTADLFYGKRIGLTATPDRVDGMHVIYDFHIGKVLYKDLTQELTPKIYFKWTGLEIDVTDPKVKEQVCDVNGELHTSMVCGYFGQWQPRLEMIIAEVRKAAAEGRKILVLSYSIDELVNLHAMWNDPQQARYTDLPVPTSQDVGETLPAVGVDQGTLRRMHVKIGQLTEALKDPKVDYNARRSIQLHIDDLMMRLKQHEVANKVRLELERRQRAYVKELLKQPSTAGLMIADVKVKERQKMLKERQVTFAVMKYGREGLDEKSLDTVFVCEPMSQKNSLQQLMGRVLRKKSGKRAPIVVFFEDNVGPMIGMCTTLRRHLRSWPHEEGGPFDYELIGHPRKGRASAPWIQTT